MRNVNSCDADFAEGDQSHVIGSIEARRRHSEGARARGVNRDDSRERRSDAGARANASACDAPRPNRPQERSHTHRGATPTLPTARARVTPTNHAIHSVTAGARARRASHYTILDSRTQTNRPKGRKLHAQKRRRAEQPGATACAAAATTCSPSCVAGPEEPTTTQRLRHQKVPRRSVR